MYPRLEININKLRHNTKTLVDKCRDEGITSIFLVTKVLAGDTKVIQSLLSSGITHLADSRIENLKLFKEYSLPKVLLRIPMECEVKDVITHVDVSCNTELETIKKLNEEAKLQNKIHSIILMFDIGDLREGVWFQEDFSEMIEEIINLDHIVLKGIGTNLTCYGGVIPTSINLNELIIIKDKIESKFDIKLDIISGGNSSSLPLVYSSQVPIGINNLRLGESVYFGKETAYGDYIDGLYNDVFELHTQIVEIKEKPSVPIGDIGFDAFGMKPTFVDRGNRKRAIVGIGKQDVYPSNIIPLDDKVEIIGGSSDHLILDLTDTSYKLGDIIKFKINYGGLLQLMTSKYVHKAYCLYL